VGSIPIPLLLAYPFSYLHPLGAGLEFCDPTNDLLGDGSGDLEKFAARDRIHYLDGGTRTVDSMVVGGVGGIMGNPRKPFRREQGEYLGLVRSLAAMRPSLLVLHQSPAINEVPYDGSSSLTECLQNFPPVLVVSGHRHWAHPGCWTLDNGIQILNVEGRAVFLRKAGGKGHARQTVLANGDEAP